MDYSYYPTTQAPYQVMEFTPGLDGSRPDPQLNDFTSSISSTPQTFDPTFEAFDRSVYDVDDFVPPQFPNHRHSLPKKPAPSISPSTSLRKNGHKVSASESKIKFNDGLVEPVTTSDPMGDFAGEDFVNRTRSSSEEKDSMTPAQTKRKAQNRAAQRAFRERKERHVRELEAKLNSLEEASNNLHGENERLRRELAKVATENEILRATSSASPSSQSMRGGPQSTRQDDRIVKTGPMKYTPTDFLAAFEVHHSADNESAQIILDSPTTNNSSSSAKPRAINHYLPAPLISSQGSFTPSAHRVSICPLTGQRLLSAGATWDYIQAHQLFKDGLVDIADVTERLKGTSACDGTGPAFKEELVKRAVEESAALGRDELI